MTTRDYSGGVEAITPETSRLQESTLSAGLRVVSVRDAKAHLSALLDEAAEGREIVITSDGKPKARLAPLVSDRRTVFRGAARHLATMPAWKGGPTAETIVRDDRDSRGW